MFTESRLIETEDILRAKVGSDITAKCRANTVIPVYTESI